MNALKNMEITFIAAATLAIAASFATADARTVDVAASSTLVAKVVEVADSSMPVVTVSARRLSAEEKAAMI